MTQENIQTDSTEDVTNDAPETNDSDVKNDKPAGYYPVDISDLPEEKAKPIKDRMDYFYKQVKDLERKNKDSDRAIREWQEQAARQIHELTSGVGQIVDHMETRTVGETENEIKKNMKEALEAGDSERYIDEQTRLTELQVKKANLLKKEEKKKATPDKNQTQQQAHAGYNDAYQVALEAVAEGDISPEHMNYVSVWQNEKDQTGNLVRPWAFNPTGGIPAPGSPMDTAMKELASIVISPRFSNMPFERQLAELDRRMGTQQSSGGQTVMGGNLTRPQKTSNIKISQDEERLAVRMKFGGPNAKSDADHVKAWRENKLKVQSGQSKRSR